MQHAGSTLKNIFRQTLKPEGAGAPLLAWPLACGAKVAERTRAVSFADGVLTVVVPDRGWIAQLESFQAQYLAALNQVSAERVNRITFTTTTPGQR